MRSVRVRILSCAVGVGLLSVSAQAGLRIAAIGDQGTDDSNLETLGATLKRLQGTPATRFDGVVFLGDNFYPRGLNGPEEGAGKLQAAVLENFKLEGRILGLPADRVHAVAGNHDYYRSAFVQPHGFSRDGNARAAAIESWTYHYWAPSEAVYAAGPGGRVEFMFFDSGRALAEPTASRRCDRCGGQPDPYTSLTQRLSDSAQRNGRDAVAWRVLAMHHPLRTVGQHAHPSLGSRLALSLLGPLVNSGSQHFVQRGYRAYVRKLEQAVNDAGVPMQLSLSGHDHSLQVLPVSATGTRPPGVGPAIQVVSGAAHEATPVEPSDPSHAVFTARTSDGKSELGFAELVFEEQTLQVRFLGAANGKPLPLGGGYCRFSIARNGDLIPPKAGEGCQ